jgi:hypothetical protein
MNGLFDCVSRSGISCFTNISTMDGLRLSFTSWPLNPSSVSVVHARFILVSNGWRGVSIMNRLFDSVSQNGWPFK